MLCCLVVYFTINFDGSRPKVSIVMYVPQEQVNRPKEFTNGILKMIITKNSVIN